MDEKKTFKKNKQENVEKNAEKEGNLILPKSEEVVLLKAVQDIIGFERELEQFKVSLAKCADFNLIDAFAMLDKEGRGYVTASELHEVLTEFNLTNAVDDCRLLFQRYNREQDGALKYSEFTDAFFPFDHKHARLLGTKQLKYSQQPSKLSFE